MFYIYGIVMKGLPESRLKNKQYKVSQISMLVENVILAQSQNTSKTGVQLEFRQCTLPTLFSFLCKTLHCEFFPFFSLSDCFPLMGIISQLAWCFSVLQGLSVLISEIVVFHVFEYCSLKLTVDCLLPKGRNQSILY